jgi:hypothetical protein
MKKLFLSLLPKSPVFFPIFVGVLSSSTEAQWVQTNGPYGGFVYSLATSGTNIFAGAYGAGILLSTNNGASWTAVNNGLTNRYVYALAVSGTNLFAGTAFVGVWRRPLLEMLPAAPTLTTTAATSVTSGSATLNGKVNPNGASTSAWFEWGISNTLSSYNTTARQSVGSGTDTVSVRENLIALNLSTTYYYRVVGQNSVRMQRGSILSFTTSAPTLVKLTSNEVPTQYVLSQNYPNPSNPSTTMESALPRDEFVTLNPVNALGEVVATLLGQRLSAGRYEVEWNANGYSSGVYFYRLAAGPFVETKKMLLFR